MNNPSVEENLPEKKLQKCDLSTNAICFGQSDSLGCPD